jgi:hypothetical protein
MEAIKKPVELPTVPVVQSLPVPAPAPTFAPVAQVPVVYTAPGPAVPEGLTLDRMMAIDWYENRQRAQQTEAARRAQAAGAGQPRQPAGSMGAINQIRNTVKEWQEFQNALSEFKPAPNPVESFMNSNMGGEVGKFISNAGTQLIDYLKEERNAKKTIENYEKMEKGYAAMLERYEQALAARAQAGGAGFDMPPPVPPPSPPQMYPNPGGQVGQALQLAQQYGGQGAEPQWGPPQAQPQQQGGFPNFNSGPGTARFVNDPGTPGIGLPPSQGSYGGGFPGFPGYGQPPVQQPNVNVQFDAVRQENERLKNELTELKDRQALLAPATPQTQPVVEAAPGLIEEGVKQTNDKAEL